MKTLNSKLSKYIFICFFAFCSATCYSQLFFPTKVGAIHKIEKGELDKAHSDLLKIIKKDTSSVICKYGLSLIYSDLRFKNYSLDTAYIYSSQCQRFVYHLSIALTWSSIVEKKELNDIEKLKLTPENLTRIQDTLTARIYKIVKTESNITKLKQFIKKHPSALEIKEAWILIYKIAYNDATRINTIEAYESYINDYPLSKDIISAKTKLYSLAFQKANEINTMESFNDFIKKYPNSIDIPNAQNNIYVLAWKIAKETNTIEALKNFISIYPKASQIEEAKLQLSELEYIQVKEKNTIETYNNFVNNYPNSKYIEEIMHKRDELSFFNPIYRNSVVNICRNKGLSGIAYMESFLNDKFNILSEVEKDSIYITFSNTYFKIIEEANMESSVDYSKLKDIRNPDIADDLRHEQTKKMENEISKYGVIIDENHNSLFCEEPNYLYNLFKGKISIAMDNYLERKKWFCEKYNNSDSGNHTYYSMEEMYNIYTFWEDFINKYPNFFLISEAKEGYSYWFDGFLHGFPYDRVFDGETNVIHAERKSFIEKIIKKNELRQSSKQVSKYYNDLKRNKFIDPEWTAKIQNPNWLIGSWKFIDQVSEALGVAQDETIITIIDKSNLIYKGHECKYIRNDKYIEFNMDGEFKMRVDLDYLEETLTFKDRGGKFIKVVTDIDGNVYNTITIGTQTWMVDNLKTTSFNDGTPIQNLTDNSNWESCATTNSPGFSWYDNDSSNKVTYGALYNGFAVKTGILAPKGWHVPTATEWETLRDYLINSGYNYDGSKNENKIAKSVASQTGWTPISGDNYIGCPGNESSQNNRVGFSAFAGGYRNQTGTFKGMGKYGLWYASECEANKSNWCIFLGNDGLSFYIDYNDSAGCYDYSNGIYVRCIKD